MGFAPTSSRLGFFSPPKKGRGETTPTYPLIWGSFKGVPFHPCAMPSIFRAWTSVKIPPCHGPCHGPWKIPGIYREWYSYTPEIGAPRTGGTYEGLLTLISRGNHGIGGLGPLDSHDLFKFWSLVKHVSCLVRLYGPSLLIPFGHWWFFPRAKNLLCLSKLPSMWQKEVKAFHLLRLATKIPKSPRARLALRGQNGEHPRGNCWFRETVEGAGCNLV